MLKLDINGVIFPLSCKKCLDEKFYLSYKCTNCKLLEFEGFN
jgi:hypothetical protein